MSAHLLETLGASVEPFLYVLILWALREKPAAFGVVLAVGFLHREFTMFALLGVGVATWWETGRSCVFRRAWTIRAACGFAAVWIAVDQLKRRINPFGPSGGASAAAPLTVQFQSLLSRVVVAPASVLPKLRQAVVECLPDMLGMRAVQPLRYNINASVVVGSAIVGAAVVAVGVLCIVRLALVWRSQPAAAVRPSVSAFCVFMAIVGIQALFAYSLSDAVDPAAPAILRYTLLALFAPIALVTAFFELDRRRPYKMIAAALLAFCGALDLRDSARVIAEYRSAPPLNEHRILADDLLAHRIRYGTAVYWDAYLTDFLARERVILASADKVRINAYQARVQANAATAVQIVRQPCAGGRRVASWCVVNP
jgi:hypothetical protein